MLSPPSILDRNVASRGAPAGPDLRIERRLPGSLTEAEVEAWRALTKRGLEPSIFADPDFVLPAAQHLAARREIVVLLAWQDRAGGRSPVLRGVLALQHPPRFRLIDAAAMPRSQLDLGSAALVDAGYSGEALRGLLDGLDAGSRRTDRVTLTDIAADGPLAIALREAAASLGHGFATRTCRRAAGTPLAAIDDPQAVTEHLADVRGVREGVELFLAFDASSAARAGAVEACLLDDPVGTTVLRVVTRRLARRRLCRVVLARHGGTLVGAAIVLRLGSRVVVWRQAGRVELPTDADASRVEITVLADRGGPGALARRFGRRLVARGPSPSPFPWNAGDRRLR